MNTDVSCWYSFVRWVVGGYSLWSCCWMETQQVCYENESTFTFYPCGAKNGSERKRKEFVFPLLSRVFCSEALSHDVPLTNMLLLRFWRSNLIIKDGQLPSQLENPTIDSTDPGLQGHGPQKADASEQLFGLMLVQFPVLGSPELSCHTSHRILLVIWTTLLEMVGEYYTKVFSMSRTVQAFRLRAGQRGDGQKTKSLSYMKKEFSH